MNGIFAVIGEKDCKEAALSGLERLKSCENELSAVAIKSEDTFSYMQYEATPRELGKNARNADGDGEIALAVCKGIINKNDCAISADSSFCIAATGELLNLDSLKRKFSLNGKINSSCEMLLRIAKVVSSDSKTDMFRRAAQLIEEEIGFIFISKDENAIYCHRATEPLWLGIGNEYMLVSSEAAALVPFALKCIYLKEGESAKLTKEKVYIFDSKLKRIKKSVLPLPKSSETLMNENIRSEGMYCPLCVKETVKHFTQNEKLNFGFFTLSKRNIEKTEKIILTGSKSAFNAALLASFNLKAFCDISTTAIEAGELRYSSEVINKGTLLIALSSDGEDINAVCCVKRAKAFGARTLGICCNSQSHLAMECDSIINPNPEASLAGDGLVQFITLHLAMSFLSLYIGYKNEIVSELYLGVTIKLSEMLSGKIAGALKGDEALYLLSKKLLYSDGVFVTGLAYDCALAQQGAKIIRDISGINAYAVSLDTLCDMNKSIIENAVVIALVTSKELASKSALLMKRLEALGADVNIISDTNTAQSLYEFKNTVCFSDSVPLFNPAIASTQIYQLALTAKEIIEQEKQAI